MACELQPGACRCEHIAPHLCDATRDGTDYEARCPVCGHGGFRISEAYKKSYRHVWTCACKRCTCKVGTLRAALLRLGIMSACLGIYNGPIAKEVQPEAARRMDLAISDILALPHMRPADMRITLAEAHGREVPADFRAFVKFARSLGISKTQAQEAAARWCRPSDRHPQTGGGVVDTSRSTDAIGVVKPHSSEAHGRPVSDQQAAGFRPSDKSDTDTSEALSARDRHRTDSDQRTLDDKPERSAA